MRSMIEVLLRGQPGATNLLHQVIAPFGRPSI